MAMLRFAAVLALVSAAGAAGLTCSAKCGQCCPLGMSTLVDDTCGLPGSPICNLCSTNPGAPPLPCAVLAPVLPTVAIPSVPANQVFLRDGAPAWTEFPDASFTSVRPFFDQVPITVPTVTIPAMTTVKFNCPAGHQYEHCDAFVFLYSCYPCAAQHGGLLGDLQVDGWQVSKCGMQFTKPGASTHKMVALRKTISAVDVNDPNHKHAAITLSSDLHFAAFAVLPQTGFRCASRTSREDCLALGLEVDDVCRWDGANCVPDYCKTTNIGPSSASCTVCVTDDFL
eukprot:TRINITY_DN1260_c0_g1_i5.p1 TRINITY_DN1260_c0_g1~~TRINITY_DN1260_c0_g1_i5.p1  ORF type:complete len:331 (+),score=75.84 TRINITY_DN1260_c0_g1_i5:143-994(+)